MRVGIIIKTKFKLTKVVKCTMMMIYLRYNALYKAQVSKNFPDVEDYISINF